jgi:glycosyltransferase involved in cell wall biosynthesis
MKIVADWVVLNEEQFIEKSVEALIPHIDYGVVVDTGSTDSTLTKVRALVDKYENLELTSVNIGPLHDVAVARNAGIDTCRRAVGDEFWYVVLAGDEIYTPGVAGMRQILEQLPDQVMWVFTWARTWIPSADPKVAVLTPPDPLRPTIFKHVAGMRWAGLHGFEHVVYPVIGAVASDNAAAGYDEVRGICDPAHQSVLAYEHMTWLRRSDRAELREQIGHEIHGHDWQDPFKDWNPVEFRR